MHKQATQNTPQRSSKSFLDRFEGRTSTIGKAGLLSLLQQNNSAQRNNSERGSRYPQQEYIKPRNEMRNPQLNSLNLGRLAQADKRSSNQSFKTQPRRSSMGSMSHLGSSNRINQKASLSNPKYALNVPLMSSVELKTERKQNLIGMSDYNQNKQNYNNKKISNDDHFKHLEFLNKFEQRMRKQMK